MLTRFLAALRPSKSNRLARVFARVGWIGFWVQLAAGSIAVMLTIYVLAFNRFPTRPRAGLSLVGYLTTASLILLAFTMFWSYRYTRLAEQIDAPPAPSRDQLIRTVWTGVMASSAGIVLSLAVMIIETSHLLFYFLAMPQGGVPVFQTPGSSGAGWVSAIDMVSLLSLTLALTGEIVVLILSLWLLFRTTQPCAELGDASSGAA